MSSGPDNKAFAGEQQDVQLGRARINAQAHYLNPMEMTVDAWQTANQSVGQRRQLAYVRRRRRALIVIQVSHPVTGPGLRRRLEAHFVPQHFEYACRSAGLRRCTWWTRCADLPQAGGTREGYRHAHLTKRHLEAHAGLVAGIPDRCREVMEMSADETLPPPRGFRGWQQFDNLLRSTPVRGRPLLNAVERELSQALPEPVQSHCAACPL